MSLGPLQVNARLLAVATATAATGGRDDWDEEEGVEPDGAATTKWEGDEPAYYREEVDNTQPGDVFVRRTLWVQTSTAKAAGIDTDDVLTIRAADGTEFTATAQAVAYSQASASGSPDYDFSPPLVSPEMETTRLQLRPA